MWKSVPMDFIRSMKSLSSKLQRLRRKINALKIAQGSKQAEETDNHAQEHHDELSEIETEALEVAQRQKQANKSDKIDFVYCWAGEDKQQSFREGDVDADVTEE